MRFRICGPFLIRNSRIQCTERYLLSIHPPLCRPAPLRFQTAVLDELWMTIAQLGLG